MLDKLSDNPLKAASWIGSSVGAVDMGLFVAADKGILFSDVISQIPSFELLGSGVGEMLVIGYVLAGAVALGDDIRRVMD